VSYHPWRALRDLTHISLLWRERLPNGDLGHCLHAHRLIILSRRQTQAERRCTIAHELVHLERGPCAPSHVGREELVVEREAARRLISIEALAEAMAWSTDSAEVAEELWVDEPMLKARLDSLHPAERAYLRQRLST